MQATARGPAARAADAIRQPDSTVPTVAQVEDSVRTLPQTEVSFGTGHCLRLRRKLRQIRCLLYSTYRSDETLYVPVYHIP